MAQPDVLTISEPRTRSGTIEWSLDLIRSAEVIAEQSGVLASAADLCDALRADPKISGALKTRIGALLGLPLSFEASSQGRRRKAASRALEAGEDWWLAYPESAVRDFLAWAVLLGVALGQNVWIEHDGRMVPRLKVWHPRHLRRDEKLNAWVLRVVRGKAGGDRMPEDLVITPGDGTWLLLAPEGEARPWMHGIWRGLSRWWLLKQYAHSDWGNYSGRKGSGIFLGIPPIGAQKDDRKRLAEDLAEMGRDAAVVPPPGYDVKLIESTANTSQTFKDQTLTADEQAVFMIHGTNMTSDGGGTYGKAAVLDGVRLQLIAADGEALSTCIHDGALTYWADFNFGDNKAAPWPHWATEAPEDLKSKGESLLALAGGLSKLAELDPRVDVLTILTDAGITMLDEPTDAGAKGGQLFSYHFDYGVLTLNEARKRLGLEPVTGGDVPPTLIANRGDEPSDPSAQPTPEPTGGDDSSVDDEGNDAGGDKPIDAKALDAITRRHLSRARTKTGQAAPHVRGQIYVDALGDVARDRASKLLGADVNAVLAAIADARSYDDVRKALVTSFRGMNPQKLADITERAVVLADLAGRLSVLEET